MRRTSTVVVSTVPATLAFTSGPAIAEDALGATSVDEPAELVPVDQEVAIRAVDQTELGVRAAAQLGLTQILDGAQTFRTPAGLGALAGVETNG